MEGLLLALFLLFSVVTALLERRKRRQQVEEDAEARQQQHRERMGTAPAVEEEEEDEELEGWPFPSGDPFDPQQPARRPAPTDSMPPATEDAQTLQAEIERQARAAEKRAQAQEAEARARARQARELRPARRVAALIGQRSPAARKKDARSRRLAGGRYHLTPEKARQAVVYAELLGPCKAEREEEWRW